MFLIRNAILFDPRFDEVRYDDLIDYVRERCAPQ